MNITSCTLTSHIAKSFKAYHTIPTSNNPKKNDPSPVDLQLRSTIHQIQYSHRISEKNRSKNPLELLSSRLPETLAALFPFSENGKERPRLVGCLEASKIEMRTRAFPFACVRCQRACTRRRAHARVRASERAHCTHATTHAHVEACRRRARNVGIT